ncbi:unnamed protein product [Lactuca virosa]|uniref:Uncharacterized protein n=1 Tax=Lactuca virosa TaxID=75947 RepID=A0AAU9N543_9ASTR|nr:unnamed protein product [Lactuca virosa]
MHRFSEYKVLTAHDQVVMENQMDFINIYASITQQISPRKTTDKRHSRKQENDPAPTEKWSRNLDHR